MGKLKIPSITDISRDPKPSKKRKLVKGPRASNPVTREAPASEPVVQEVRAGTSTAEVQEPSPPSAALVRSYDRERERPTPSPVEESKRQFIIPTVLSIFGDPSRPVDGNSMFLLPRDLSHLQEMGSRRAADMGNARTL